MQNSQLCSYLNYPTHVSEFIDQLLDSDSIILVIPATFAVCYLLVAFIRKKIREARLRNVATGLKMKFSARINQSVTTTHNIPDLVQAFRVKLRNLFIGQIHGLSLVIYDQTNTRRKNPAIRRTFARIDMKQFNLPDFHLTPNAMIARIFYKLMDGAVNFEEDKIFSKTFRLSGDNSLRSLTGADLDALRALKDYEGAKNLKHREILTSHNNDNEAGLRSLFQQTFRTLCLKHDNWHIKSKNGYLYFNWSNKRLAPRKYSSFVDSLSEIVHYLQKSQQLETSS